MDHGIPPSADWRDHQVKHTAGGSGCACPWLSWAEGMRARSRRLRKTGCSRRSSWKTARRSSSAASAASTWNACTDGACIGPSSSPTFIR